MKRSNILRTIVLAILAVSVLSQTASYAQPFAQLGPAQPVSTQLVYLPLIEKGGPADPAMPTPPTPTPPTPTPAPLAVRFTFDAASAAHAEISPEGGALSAIAADGTRFDLSIPPDALDFTETITMTPAKTVAGLPLSGGMVGAVDLEPAGLGLFAPAILRITPAKAPAGPIVAGFAFDGQGANFHLYPTIPPAGNLALQASTPTAMKLVEMRPAGAGSGTQADIDEQMLIPLDNPKDKYEQEISVDPDSIELNAGYYQELVLPALQQAINDTSKLNDATLQIYWWLTALESAHLEQHFAAQIAQAKRLLSPVLARAASEALNRCYTQHRPEEAFTLQELAYHARELQMAADLAAIQAKLAKCLQFKLTFHSKISKMLDGKGFILELKSELTLRATDSTRATGTGTLQWINAEWVGDYGICSYLVTGAPSAFNAAGPRFGLNLTRVSRHSPAVRISLRYDPGKPVENAVMVCPSGAFEHPPTTHWSDSFTLLHKYETDSISINAKATIVQVGSFSGWVYHNTGNDEATLIEDTEIDIEHTPTR